MAKKKGRDQAVGKSRRKTAKKNRVRVHPSAPEASFTPLSEFEHLAAELTSILRELPPSALTDNDVTFLDNPFKAMRADLRTFFSNNPSFDFKTTPVDLYLQEGRDQKLRGVVAPSALRKQLRTLQRVFNRSRK